jgi:hypothetical protein
VLKVQTHNIKEYLKDSLLTLVKVLLVSLILSASFQAVLKVYEVGYRVGYNEGRVSLQSYYDGLLEELAVLRGQVEKEPAVITREIVVVPTEAPKDGISFVRNVDWGGPELWDAVNKKRQEYGVNPLSQKDNLCTVASIRLNELLELGKLDGHEGFNTLTQRRPDLEDIFEDYSTVAEFLAAGASSSDETVALWENTLAHKKLLTGGEYVWGCIYAQNSFAVAITAF